MSSAKRVYFDTLRSLDNTGISSSYAAVGTAFAFNSRIICITNLTQGIMIFSTDSSVSSGQIIVPAGSFKLLDLTANIVPGHDDNFTIRVGTQFYVKQLTAPSSGAVYIESIYAY